MHSLYYQITMTEPSTICDWLRGLDPVEQQTLAQWVLRVFIKWPLQRVPENWQDKWQDHLSDLIQITANHNDQTFRAVSNLWTLIDAIDHTSSGSTTSFLQSIRTTVLHQISKLRRIDPAVHIVVESIANMSHRGSETTDPPFYCD